MSILHSKAHGGGGVDIGDNIANSLRLRASNSAHLTRTFGSGDRRRWTFSLWLRRGSTTTAQEIISAVNGQEDQILFQADGRIRFYIFGSTTGDITTTSVFRDPSKWLHVVLIFDSANATAADRAQIWVNGVRQPVTTSTTFALNADSAINSAVAHFIGRYAVSAVNFYDGGVAAVNFVGGQVVDPTAFGRVSSDTGAWVPKTYSGTYGTNGFKLDFSNGTSLTTLGNDSSGNNNHWTLNNFSLTPGPTYDWFSEGTNVYPVMNPLDLAPGLTVTDANLRVTSTSGGPKSIYSSLEIPADGLWYAEATNVISGSSSSLGLAIGLARASKSRTAGLTSATTGSWHFYASASGGLFTNGSTAASGLATVALSELFKIAVNVPAGNIWIGRGSTWYNSTGGTTGDPATNTNPTFALGAGNVAGLFMFLGIDYAGTNGGWAWNSGQQPFTQTPPTGFKALCTANMPDVTGAALKPRKHFDVLTHAGNDLARNITGALFTPGLVWPKSRTTVSSHRLMDAVRGFGTYAKTIASDSTAAEAQDGLVTAFIDGGFSIAAGNNFPNASGQTYVDWLWNMGDTTVTNTAGSISSQVRANVEAGQSIVLYTGNGTAGATVGHGLGKQLSLILEKDLDAGSFNWSVQGGGKLWTPATSGLFLNATNALNPSQISSGVSTSSVFYPASPAYANVTGHRNIAYCFAEIPGYSKISSYIGNGLSTGNFVYCGFLPRFILIKRTDAVFDWYIYDTARGTFNVLNPELYPNSSAAEGGGVGREILITSNGFSIINANAGHNASGGTYIFYAVADINGKYSPAR